MAGVRRGALPRTIADVDNEDAEWAVASTQMDINGHVERVNYHLKRMGVESRPDFQTYLEAWNNQMPARRMAETYQRRLRKESINPSAED